MQATDVGELAGEVPEPARTPAGTTAPAPPSRRGHPLRAAVLDFQRQLVREALAANDGNWAAAARELGLHRSRLGLR